MDNVQSQRMVDEGLEALADRLRSLDLEDREARVYAYLVARGPARAGEAAAATRLKRTETYRTLQSLMERGMVTAQLGRPAVYQALPIDSMIAGALARHEERRREIERARDRISDALQTARSQVGAKRTGYKILQGRRAIHTALEEMLARASSTHWTATTYLAARNATAQNRPYQAFLRRARDGLPMRIIVCDTPGIEEVVEDVETSAVSIRYFDTPHDLRFSIVDGREILFWLVHDPDPALDARGDVAIWTDAMEFVRAQGTFFEALWERARPRKSG